MAGRLGSLVLELSANVARLEGDLRRGADAAGRELGRIGRAANRVRTLIGGIGIGISVVGIQRFAKAATDMADEMHTVSKRTGIAVEQLSALRFAAEQSGASFEALKPGLVFFEKTLAAAGISGQETVSMLLGLADQLAATEDPAKKLELAMLAFGRSAGPQMVEFLTQGSEAIKAQMQAAQESGRVLSGEAAAAADELNDALGNLGQQALTAGLALGEGGLLPSLTGGVKALGDFAAGITKFLQGDPKALPEWATFAAVAFNELKAVFTVTGTALGALGAALSLPLGEGFRGGYKKIFEEFESDARNIKASSQDGLFQTQKGPLVPKTEAADKGTVAGYLAGRAKKRGGTGGGGGGKSPAAQLAEDVEELEQSLRTQIATFGESSMAVQLYELSLRGATEAQLAEARELAVSLQGMEDAEKEKKELADRERERAELYQSTLKDLAEGTQQNNLDLIASDQERAMAQLAIEQERWRAVIETYAAGTAERMRLEEGYAAWLTAEQATITASMKTKTDEMTEFTREAARNMQDAMADFFFDLMQGKLSDLAESFKRTIDRMVANALAARLANALFGEGFTGGGGGKGGGAVGGWVGSAITGIASLLAAQGAAFESGGGLTRFAGGGIVRSPTVFRFAGGAGLMGEAGPEAIMPLKRLPSGQLGVAAAGGGGMSVVMNIQTPDADSFRRSQGQILAQMNQALSRGRRNL